MGHKIDPRTQGHHAVNSWEEEDVKRGRKLMAEGHKGHAEALFDDAHGSYNWDGHNSTGPEMNTSPAKMKSKLAAAVPVAGQVTKATKLAKNTSPANMRFSGWRHSRELMDMPIMDHGAATPLNKQGYVAREDESLGMRTGAERNFSQTMKARREDSYGKWGKRDAEHHGDDHINR